MGFVNGSSVIAARVCLTYHPSKILPIFDDLIVMSSLEAEFFESQTQMRVVFHVIKL